MKTAIIIGATGVTGRPLTNYLLNSANYSRVVVFSRRAINSDNPKLTNHIVDFDQPEQWSEKIQGDDLFCTMGTTLKQAGSKAAQYKVDYTYQANTLEAAATNGVRRLFLVSSPGANINSRLFYPKLKGELDAFALAQPFTTQVLFKPSLIAGDRADNRIGEKIGKAILSPLCRWFSALAPYRPIQGSELGRAIGHCAETFNESGVHTIELDRIFTYLPE
ncbi:MAG: NAD(P)H-binding protein [Cellvibrionaceae bacterium]